MSGMMNSMLSALHLSSSKPSGSLPTPPTDEEYNKLKEKYVKAKQDHVFHYWDDLVGVDKAALFQQLSDIDPEHVNEIAEKALKPPKPASKDEEGKKDNNEEEETDESKPVQPELEPLPESATASTLDASREDLDSWYDHGLSLIATNKVGVVLMAGGQGTRLGSSAPKGCYNIGLPSAKSLFQLQAERIIKVQELAAAKHDKQRDEVVVPWYVMTSGPTRRATEEFFESQSYFGLKKENVMVFEQGTLPCLSNEGKILLEEKGKVAVAPDGNGGLYQAMFLNSVISDLSHRSIQHIHAYCVDNSLVKVADPTFIGFAANKEVSIATKVVRKRNAKESVGLILQKDGKPDVVEYSEIDSSLAEAKDPKNSELLKFRAANIVNHYYSFAFLQSIPQWAHKLPHHVARKKIPSFDLEKNELIAKPEKPNGVKLEQFVFDCFPFLSMDKFACLEVRREDEFSPLKNAPGTGEDDPESSRRDIMMQGKRWMQEAGAVVVSEGKEEGVEVSPLISYAGEGLTNVKGQSVKAPAVIEREKA